MWISWMLYVTLLMGCFSRIGPAFMSCWSSANFFFPLPSFNHSSFWWPKTLCFRTGSLKIMYLFIFINKVRQARSCFADWWISPFNKCNRFIRLHVASQFLHCPSSLVFQLNTGLFSKHLHMCIFPRHIYIHKIIIISLISASAPEF